MIRQNLAAPTDKKLLGGLHELANLRDEVKAVEHFIQHWPSIAEQPESFPQGFSLARQGSRLPKPLEYVLVLRNRLREVWTGGPEANSILTAFFLTSSPITDLWRPLPPVIDTLVESVDVVGSLPSHPLPSKGRFEADWRRAGFVYRPETQLQKALHLLLQSSARAKLCANPECPAPYFIAKKSGVRYCSTECSLPLEQCRAQAAGKGKGETPEAPPR